MRSFLTLAIPLLVQACTVFTSDEPSEERLAAPSTEIQPIRPAASPPAEPEATAEPVVVPRPAIPVARPEPAQEGIAARHILIQYRGANRASAEITRSQDEARAEAERIMGLAKQPDADFAALAREHSEDPGSGPRGGDLGSFGRGAMHPAFENAAFDLDVGEVSEVVETPFGYHVIQRTR